MQIRSLARKLWQSYREVGMRETILRSMRRLMIRSGGLIEDDRSDFLDIIKRQEKQITRLQESVAWLGQHHNQDDGVNVMPLENPLLVSIIMPVRNADSTIVAAIESVLAQSYSHFELLIVNDGSTDGSATFISAYASDRRVRCLEQSPLGVCAARNWALTESRGEIVAYLDADNIWQPSYLNNVVRSFTEHPDTECVYLAQLVYDNNSNFSHIRAINFDREKYRQCGGIDINVFSHRLILFKRHGGFDKQLTRLVDWDLIARYTEDRDPLTVPIIGGSYWESRPGSISDRESYWRNAYLIQRKLERPIKQPLRVLYVLWHYPQLTESYVRWEIVCMLRWGVQVEVWSELQTTNSPFEAEVPVHHGTLSEAIEQVDPHILHIHWLHSVFDYRDIISRSGLPLTVRSHGFEYSPETLRKLQSDHFVQSIYLFPHFADQAENRYKLVPVRSGFNGDLYYPNPNKDRRLVLRVGAALPTKDLETFVQVAKLCPKHRFVIVLGKVNGPQHYLKEFLAFNESEGNPVEVHTCMQADEISALMREAGIYLHTFGFVEPFGMPMSLSEAMATGSYTLVRKCAAATINIGETGALYQSAEQAAALIHETVNWSDEQWRQVQLSAVEHAYNYHADNRAFRPILDDWLRIARGRLFRGSPKGLSTPKVQQVLEYLITEAKADNLRHFDSSFVTHLIGTYQYLKEWNCDSEICIAGLLHSLYGTESTGGWAFPLDRRDEVRKLAGERAEMVAYFNCAMHYPTFDRALADHEETYLILDRFEQAELKLNQREFDDLALVHLADWLEQVPRSNNWPKRREAYKTLAERLGGPMAQSYEKVFARELVAT